MPEIVAVCAVHQLIPDRGKGVTDIDKRPVAKALRVHPLGLYSDVQADRQHHGVRALGVDVVKVQGAFVWHKHDDTDDFFLVLKGVLDIELRDRTVTLKPGQMYIVPKGVEHRPVAREEAHLLLIEPTGTANTGDAATAAARKVV